MTGPPRALGRQALRLLREPDVTAGGDQAGTAKSVHGVRPSLDVIQKRALSPDEGRTATAGGSATSLGDLIAVRAPRPHLDGSTNRNAPSRQVHVHDSVPLGRGNHSQREASA